MVPQREGPMAILMWGRVGGAWAGALWGEACGEGAVGGGLWGGAVGRGGGGAPFSLTAGPLHPQLRRELPAEQH